VGSLLSGHFQRETNECTFTYSCASSKHLQTRRFLDTITQYLQDVQRLVMHIYRQANERTSAFVDHSGLVIDACTGSGLAINHLDDDDDTTLGDDDGEPYTLGYSFYDSVSILVPSLDLVHNYSMSANISLSCSCRAKWSEWERGAAMTD
jgi:hypothetical protein